MKNEKYMFPRGSVTQPGKMARFLEVQARKGWLLVEICKVFWRFKRIEPKKLHFCVTYFPHISAQDTNATPELLEYREMCAHDGWKLATALNTTQVFYHEGENPIPIETDPMLQVQTIHDLKMQTIRGYGKELIGDFFWLLVFALMGMKVGMIKLALEWYPIFLLLAAGLRILMILLETTQHFLWFWRAKRYAGIYGELLEPGSTLTRLGLICMLAVTLWFTYQMCGIWLWLFNMVFVLGLVFPVICWISDWLWLHDVTGKQMAVIGLAFGIGFIFVLRMSASLADALLPEYHYPGSKWTSYEDDPPMTIWDIAGPGAESSNALAWSQETIVLAKYFARTSCQLDGEYLSLDYDVIEVKWPFLYDLFLKDDMGDHSYVETDPTPWGADRAYYSAERNDWILCYEDRFVGIGMPWEPSAEEMAQVGALLG